MNIKSLFIDAFPLLVQFAPSLAKALGGSFGAAAGYALPILASAFGAKPSNIKELVDKILTDSEAQSKLEALEHEHGDWVCSLMDSVTNLSSAKINIELTWQPVQST